MRTTAALKWIRELVIRGMEPSFSSLLAPCQSFFISPRMKCRFRSTVSLKFLLPWRSSKELKGNVCQDTKCQARTQDSVREEKEVWDRRHLIK
ncbi:hypothetical protein PoB_007479400 [Plakobranchus ocellatus]|uniref:Uncharacterized protein n=1 Tax=Plakobranchus ocellatus TaxID=259542 RepID=A0AAV4DW10_9GAST|nr:hypothetical protein PoB_007479400 [Plakobranchus ocellatus]